jgi:hypothetical protein
MHSKCNRRSFARFQPKGPESEGLFMFSDSCSMDGEEALIHRRVYDISEFFERAGGTE